MVYAVRHVQLCMAFSSRVKPKHGKLAGYQHTAFFLTTSITERNVETLSSQTVYVTFLTQNGNVTVQCWLDLVSFYVKQLGKKSRLLDANFKNKHSNNDKQSCAK